MREKYLLSGHNFLEEKYGKYPLTFVGIIIFALAVPISNSGMEIGKAIIICSWLIERFCFKQKSNHHFGALNWILFGLIATNIISCLVNINGNNYEIVLNRAYHNSSRVLLCMAVMHVSLDDDKMLLLFKIIAISIIVETGYILSDYLTNPLINHPRFRVGGWLGCVNNTGQMYSITFPVIFITIFYFYRNYKWQIFFVLASLASIFGNIMTGSRLPIAVIGFHIFFLTFLSLKKGSWLKLLLVLSLIIIGLFSYHTFPRIQVGFSKSVLSLDFETRLPIWEVSLDTALENPIVGIGPGLLVKEFRQNDIPRHFHSHNNFLNEFAMVGSLGLLLVIFFHVYLAILFWNKRKLIFNRRNLIPLGLFGTFLSSFILGTIDYTFYGVVAGHLMWFFLGILINYLTNTNNTKELVIKS